MEQTSTLPQQTNPNRIATIIDQLKVIICIYILVLTGQMIAKDVPLPEVLIAALISFMIVIIAVTVKNLVSRPNLPGFAWATLISFLLTLPISPLQELIVSHVSKLNFMVHVTPLMAFAGISVVDKLDVMRKMGWKIVVVAMIVMASTYLGSALIAQLILKYNGLI